MAKSRNKGKTISRRKTLERVIADIERAGLHVTQGYRNPKSRLGLQTPRSLHTRSMAFDTRARTGKQADAVMASIRAELGARGLKEGRDYSFIDEVRNPSRHATAPHVHTQFTQAGMARYNANADVQTARPSVLPGPDMAARGVPVPTPRPDYTPSGLLAPTVPSNLGLRLGDAMPAPGRMADQDLANVPQMPGVSDTALERWSRTMPDVANAPSDTFTEHQGIPGVNPSRFAAADLPTTGALGTSVQVARAAVPNANSVDPARFGRTVAPSAAPSYAGLPPGSTRAASPQVAETEDDAQRMEREMGMFQPDTAGVNVPTPTPRPDNVPTPTPRPDTVGQLDENGVDVNALNDVADDSVGGTTGNNTLLGGPPPEDRLGIIDAPFPDAPSMGWLSDQSKTGMRFGSLIGGLPGMAIGGLLGRGLAAFGKPGFNEAVPDADRFSTGSGLSGIMGALSGKKGATGTSLSNPGMSVTALDNGQSLRRSDKFGWTEVVGPDGSVRGIQYDDPDKKGLLGSVSRRFGDFFGSGRGNRGLSPAGRAEIDRGGGGLY